MSASLAADWTTANQRWVTAALARLRALVEGDPDAAVEAALAQAAAGLPAPAALDVLGDAFGLTPFERDVVLLAAGVELDAAFAEACARASGGVGPTFALALAVLPGAHWSALTPAAPLRRWRLVEPAQGERPTTAPLRADERVLHFLAGVSHVDERLHGLVVPIADGEEPGDAVAAAARTAAAAWRGPGPHPLIQLATDELSLARAVTAAAAAELGALAFALDADDVPASAAERDAFARLWEREAALLPAVLLVHGGEESHAVAQLVDTLGAPVAVDAGIRPAGRAVVRVEVPTPPAAERERRWQGALGPAAASLDGAVPRLARQFKLGGAGIRAAAASALLGAPSEHLADALWDACRVESRHALEALAQRVEAAAAWDDLVLPEAELAKLRQVAVHVRRRAQVYEEWGFGERVARGLGIVALFAGASGTGKTLAAEVIAADLRLDLYRIDLSRVVSKYIGETEKNLRRVFDAADAGGAVLLFDEADALFGKRSEVKDSHDRYANIEISYLLQRMEAYDGLAILTTNMRSALDSAFLRRIRFVVEFPFPGETERTEIWRRVLPARTPTAGLDLEKLARPALAGGNIRNVALGGAFLAADEGEPVGMRHLRRALESEYEKLERPLVEHEVGGWT